MGAKGALVDNWSDLAGDEDGGRARGEMGGGHQRAVWEQQTCIGSPF